MLSGIGYQPQVEGEVMDRGYLHGQQFLRLEEMMEIGLRVDTVYLTAIGINGREVVLPLLVPHVHRSLISEQHGVATVAGWHHTVEHVASDNGDGPLEGCR